MLVGYLCDPYTEQIMAVPFDGDHRTIYNLIGADGFEAAILPSRDAIYVDDNGRITATYGTKFIMIRGVRNPLAGKGVILGVGPQGESTNPRMSLDYARQIIRFRDAAFVHRYLVSI